MSSIEMNLLEKNYTQFVNAVLKELKPGEHLTINLDAEQSHFIRFNNSKVRQSGVVSDSVLGLQLFSKQRTASLSFPFSSDLEHDLSRGLKALATLRTEVEQLPEDPNMVLPLHTDKSRTVAEGKLLDFETAAESLLASAQGVDCTGYYTSGPVVRAVANSAGQLHWFVSSSFFVDFSLWHKSGKAVKSGYAGTHWNQDKYENEIALARASLAALDLPAVELPPGEYRAYLAPAAVSELLGMFSWNCLSESAIRQKESAMVLVREGHAHFSPMFSLSENFKSGLVPRFNETGELAPEKLSIIEQGQLKNTLVHSRTAKEYGIEANGASSSEGLRSPEVAPGSLTQEQILQKLGTGVFLSNLHYINWSDALNGRITGMTRYSCFYVENGKLKGPLKDMRFDDTLFSIFGKNLEAVTAFQNVMPNTSTYERRQLGAEVVPGVMLSGFKFTL